MTLPMSPHSTLSSDEIVSFSEQQSSGWRIDVQCSAQHRDIYRNVTACHSVTGRLQAHANVENSRIKEQAKKVTTN